MPDRRTFVIVGASLAGSKAAETLRGEGFGGRLVLIGDEAERPYEPQLGEVVLIDPMTTPLERVLGPEVGTVYADLHARHGVELHLNTSVDAFVGHGHVEGVRTTGGETLAADVVVVGIGVEPRTELAAEAGLDLDNGIAVDEQLQTSVPGGSSPSGSATGASWPA